ncbi:Starch-binding associating with outer membrane [Tenacibaculum sp. MAR_2009_124]|uniref:RagB/SusD family nutrient uptake outer membrane protein n=1 Tax=Tenacibaculum sp. MAR_2009_124 TaxID=1250059 RepID=UPI00089C9270|nr:RagB/SusD family nutrient uptake outer membrane protein [Tenacibaculum sp. MAR_2009_124]SEC19696.1 Starch-binding associating with outer membrane [Tenacibaculum sp. MAR_2009_124]
MENKILNRVGVILMSISLIFTMACTDLEVEQTDSILGEAFDGLDSSESSAQVDDMYNQIRGYIGDQANTFALSEVTTDALLIPTRGSDWGDNGIWRQLHQHSWTPDHAYITNVWNQWNQLQLSGSRVIDDRSAPSAEVKAHALFLRGLAMFVILDNFGQVPFRDTKADPIADPDVFTGADAVNFIVTDLEAAISGLPEATVSGDNVRSTKAAGRYLLAKVLLNKHIYTKSGSADAADMTRVISLVDEIASQGFALQSGYFDIFKDTPDTETIWYINTGVGNRIFNGLHYNSTTAGGGGWNGFSTLAEYYDLFEGDANNNRYDASGMAIDGQEERRGGVPPSGDGSMTEGSNVGFGFLIGQQYDLDGTPLEDRAGAPLSFTREFTSTATGESSLVDNGEVSGIRMMKYNPRYGGFTEHEIFFRYADAYLMKAEAMMRSGGDATTMVNTLRTMRGAATIASVSEQDLIDERGRELYMEFWRRNDLIRFGQYTRDWEFKDPSAIGNADRQLFPIPASQIILNPNLTQNPGY